MAKTGRPPLVDEVKKREILALASVGCSGSMIAHYTGLSLRTFWRTLDRDKEFGEKFRQARMGAEILQLQNIRTAGAKYWRAAAWHLERMAPSRYMHYKPELFTRDRISDLLAEMASVMLDGVPDLKTRRKVRRALNRVIRGDALARKLDTPQRKFLIDRGRRSRRNSLRRTSPPAPAETPTGLNGETATD